MSEFDNIKKDILESAKKMGQSRTSGYDTTATVTRIEGSTAWVHIPGGVIETPAQLTISAKAGDAVQVRVADGAAWITGNATAPPTDDRTAVAASVAARTAQQTADTVSAKVAVIEKAYITEATVETLLADYASIDYLEANYATITELHTDYAQINLANIDTANISKASIRDLFTEVGLIASATIVDGKITGYLDAVNVNAANITAGTLVADRIAIRGSNSSLVYALNNYGQITSTQVNTLDGYVLTPRTINADKIVAGTITATEIAASTITANKLNVSTLSSVAADIGTVTAGVLKSTDYSYSSGTYTTAGMIIDLTNKVIRMPNTAILSDGSLYSKKGSIGGWTIGETTIFYEKETPGAGGNDRDYTLLGSDRLSGAHETFGIAESSGYTLTTKGGLSLYNGGKLVVSSSMGNHTDGVEVNASGVKLFHSGGGIDASCNLTRVGSEFSSDSNITAPTFIGSLTGHASLDLPLTGGTLTGNITIGETTDTVSRGVTSRNSLGNVGLTVGTDGSHGLYSGTKGGFLLYATKDANSTNSTLYVPRPINVSGLASVGNNVIATASDTSERYFRAVNSNGSIELNAAQYNKGVYDRSGGRWIMYLATNSAADTSIKIPRGVQIGEADANGFIELYHATPYIDFHFGRSTADYTYRIMESSSGVLWFSGSQSVAGNITISTTSTTVERAVTVSTGNVSGAVRANNGGSGGAFGLYVTKTGGTARTGTWLSAMDSGGTYHANWTSDRREKNLIGLMSDQEAETLLRNIDIINFSYKSDQNQIIQNGMIAQQMRDVLTENGIGYRSYLNITATHDDDFIYDLNAPEADVRYGIDYARLTPILWKGWQLHDERIAALEAEIKALKGVA